MRKFFTDNLKVADGNLFLSDNNLMHHIKNVLRIKKDEKILIQNNASLYESEILDFEKDCIKLKIVNERKTGNENSSLFISLFQGYPKQKKLEFIIQKGTELGIDEFNPFVSERSILPKGFDENKKNCRLVKIAKEAAEQSKRESLPALHGLEQKNAVLEKLKKDNFNLIILLYESEKNVTIKNLLKNNLTENNLETEGLKIAIIIGPEGGFSEKEVLEFEQAGAKIASLGKNILRTETAGLAATAMIKYEFEL